MSNVDIHRGKRLERQFSQTQAMDIGGGRTKAIKFSSTSPIRAPRLSLHMNMEAFEPGDMQGGFSFDEFLGTLVAGIMPSTATEMSELPKVGGSRDGNGESDLAIPHFQEAKKLLPLFRDTRKELVDLCYQVDARLEQLRNVVAKYETVQQKKFAQLEDGVERLEISFNRLDSRVTTVAQTASKIGDRLEVSDSQKNTANRTIDLVKYMMYFNVDTGDDLEKQPSLFSDENRIAEATAVALTLRAIAEDNVMGVSRYFGAQTKNTSPENNTLEVAMKNLQVYCNELENRLLVQFDAASQMGDVSLMADSANILSQFNRGTSVMQRYVASRPMFMDLAVMNMDARSVLGAEGGFVHVDNLMEGLTSVYKDIIENVEKEAAIVVAVFPTPTAVMSILVQRVLEQRVSFLMDKLLPKPSLTSPTPVEQGGLRHFLRILAGAYGKTKELANELQAFGCGDLNVEALSESLFTCLRDDYSEVELTSLDQLHKAKLMELALAPLAELTATSQGGHRNSATHFYPPITVTVVEEFVQWNEEAVTRCKLLTLEVQPGLLATNVRAIFTCLLDQMGRYVTEGLERAKKALKEAAALRERFGYNTTSNRRVAAAVAAAAEAASVAGETSFRAFMVAIQSATINVAMVQRYFVRTVSRLLTSQEGAHVACCEAISTTIVVAEKAALTGLQSSISGLLAEVERILIAEQKETDYKLPEEENVPHYVTDACMSGGLRLKRDVSEYAEFVRGFKATAVNEKFGLLCMLVNVFIVAPENLPTLVEGTLSEAKKEAISFIELREDYKTANIASMLNSANI